MVLYRTILKEAIKNSWKNKYLWFFGLFAALLGSGGELELVFRGFNSTGEGLFPGLRKFAETGIFSKNALVNLGHIMTEQPFQLFMVAVVFMLLLLMSGFIIWLAIASQAALVSNSSRITTGKNHDFKEGVDAGIKRFWPVLGLNAILRIIVYILFLIVSIPIIKNGYTGSAASNLFFIIFYILFIPAAIIFSFIIKYAICFVVIKGNSFFESIKLGWKLFSNNWLVSMEMAFILFFVNFLVGLGLIMLFFILAVPFLFVVFVLSQFSFYFNMMYVVLAAAMLFLAIIIIVGSMLSTFQIYSWTTLYVELVSRGGVSKLVRMFSGKTNKE